MSRQLECAFHAVQDPIAIIGADGTILRVNDAFCQRFDTTPDEAAGSDAAVTIFGGVPQGGAADQPLVATGQPYLEERRDLSVAGVFEVSCHPVDLGDEQGVICVLCDVTDRELVEAEREALLRQLEDKNAELERYTYTVSHDLKSPLVTIKGFLGLVERDALAGDVERLRSDIARVGHAADRMAQLLDELLELSRIGRMVNPPEDVSLRAIAEEAADLVNLSIGGRAVEVTIGAGLGVARGDRLRLLEVFQNLLENAVRFMGDQSRPRIEIGSRLERREAVCYMRDNGIGIEPRYHERIFGLFDQLDPSLGGTGIGLALVRRIIRVHGGRVWVESDGAGKGASFYFTLPLSAPTREVGETRS